MALVRTRMLFSWAVAAASIVAAVGVLGLPKLLAQSHTPAGYEVASIKRSHNTDPRSRRVEFLPGGRFRSTGVPFLIIFGIAYNIPTGSVESVRQRVKGMPDWILTEPYDIQAIPEESSQLQAASSERKNERVRQMLRSVLADRLELRVREIQEEMPAYAMVIGKHGPALQKSKVAEQECVESAPFSPISPSGPGCHQFQGGMGRGLRGNAVTMTDLALYVSNWSELPVVDETGLKGLYAIQTEGWRSESDNDANRSTLDEVFDRLGLKLVRRKAPVNVLLVEHVARPSEN